MGKVLVTGGAGFAGSHMVRELLGQGHEVAVFDAFVQYVQPLVSNYHVYMRYRFEDIKNRVKIIRGNTLHKDEVRRTINEFRPSKIIHLAGLPLAGYSRDYPEEAINSILIGATNVLDVIKDVGFVDRFVYASSSMVYGDFESEPASEKHPTRPKDIYGAAKLAGEHVTHTYNQHFGVEYTIIRPSAVYGPGDANRRVVQIFMENALRSKPVKLFNGGSEKLDFTYVKDAAKGTVLATFSPAAKNEIFNITRGEGRSIKELGGIFKTHFPELELAEEGKAAMERPKRGALDISKAREILGYSPEYSLEKGIAEYVEFMRKVKNENPSLFT